MKPIAEGKHVYLRSYIPSDIRFLYDIFCDYDELYLWNNDRELHTFEDFNSSFQHRVDHVYRHFCMICTANEKEKIGFIYSYNVHSGDGYAYTTIYIVPQWRRTIFAAEAGLLYYSHLFRFFNYRKIYSEVYAYNKPSSLFLQTAGFIMEGCLKQHRYYQGDFVDLLIYSIQRGTFFEKHSDLIRLMEGDSWDET